MNANSAASSDARTPDDITRLHEAGRMTDTEVDAWWYVWRDSVYRFSGLGELAAKRHAKRHGLPLPQSDRETPPALERVRELLHHELGTFRDEEIAEGRLIVVKLSDAHAYGFLTHGMSPTQAVSFIDGLDDLVWVSLGDDGWPLS